MLLSRSLTSYISFQLRSALFAKFSSSSSCAAPTATTPTPLIKLPLKHDVTSACHRPVVGQMCELTPTISIPQKKRTFDNFSFKFPCPCASLHHSRPAIQTKRLSGQAGTFDDANVVIPCNCPAFHLMSEADVSRSFHTRENMYSIPQHLQKRHQNCALSTQAARADRE